MSRKRGTLEIPEEMQTNERLSTKKELADKGRHPSCPVPLKLRKSITSKQSKKKLAPLCFNNNVLLSPLYDPKQRVSYLDQVFIKLGSIGEGSFGRVYKVKSKEDKNLYALKRIKNHISFNDRCAEVKNNEILGWHPNCVQFFMAWEENFGTYMLLEYCDMSLADYAKLNNDIPETLLWLVLHDICKALDFLHKKQFLHLDVKPGNIMMKKGVLKLGDFGLLVDLQSNDQVNKSTLSDGDSKYLAVEVLDGIYTTACDIFGLGLTILELATDIELPEHGILWRQLRNGTLPLIFYDRVSSALTIVVEKMISKEYKNRPTTQKMLSCPKLQNISKRDAKCPRVDFAAPFIKEDQNCNMPLSPIVLNTNKAANVSTPPFNKVQSTYSSDSDIENSDDESNSHIIKCKKSLFSGINRNSLSPENIAVDKPLILINSQGDSGMDCDSVDLSAANSEKGDTFSTGTLITSTPVMANRQVRRIPKTKLVFD
ncbi:probable protein kinase DDB_G0291842 [Euwallacea fornicatus]|uniref:probable protein kinase DDB_G0291842 n=1 Tax=Euwallacea fornicatus TaxID=995702 RepID=UPI00338E1C41